MATIESFEDLKSWQNARTLCLEVSKLVKKENFSRDFKFVNQINGSSGSIMDNIAEGFGRESNNEFIQFLGYSIGSSCELKSQLYRALDRNYISKTEFDNCYNLADFVSRTNKNLIKYLNNCEHKGLKFKGRGIKK